MSLFETMVLKAEPVSMRDDSCRNWILDGGRRIGWQHSKTRSWYVCFWFVTMKTVTIDIRC